MKSLKTELEKVKDLLQQDEIVDNKDTISFYTLNKIIEEELSYLNIYDENYKKNFLKTIDNDIKKCRGNIFSKNRHFMRNLKTDFLSLYIDNHFGNKNTSDILIYFKNKINPNLYNCVIHISKNKEVEDITIYVSNHNYVLSEEEKNEIIRFISDNYYKTILKIINDLEKVINLQSTSDNHENTLYIYDRFDDDNIITSQTFKKDFLNIKFITNILGYNKIDIEFSDNDIKSVFDNKLLKPIELIDILTKFKDSILKRISININDLNIIYKKIVTESNYYKNLCDPKTLKKKL